MGNQRLRELCETALFVALVFLGIFIVRIPGPFGYLHFGDCMIILAVIMLGTKRGAFAGGVGAAIADLLSGFPVWAIPSLVIKAAMAVAIGALLHTNLLKEHRVGRRIACSSIGGLVQMVLYPLFFLFMFGKGAMIADIAPITLQTVFGVAAGVALAEALEKTPLRAKMVN
ncbi:MAG: ECF transporter S component [Anaerovoracaceae bacterium]